MTHRIVTIDSPAPRDLKGKLKLELDTGADAGLATDYAIFRQKPGTSEQEEITLPYELDITEPDHVGDDVRVHDWHAGFERFTFRRTGNGPLKIKCSVKPTQGAVFKTATLHLVPVEVEQQNYTPAQGIRFCRWLDSFTANALDSDCADKDRDRFRIRIPAVLPNLTKIHIKSTGLLTAVIDGQWQSKTSDGDYDVTLTEENGALVSTWMLLVSDGDDDVGYNGKGTENGTDDQTLLADFDSPIEVTMPELNNAKVVFSAQKPLGDVEIQPYYLSPAGDVPPEVKPLITNHLQKMKEIYRQIGVRAGNYRIIGKTVPQAWFDVKPAPNSSGDYYYLSPPESNIASDAVLSLTVPGKQIRIGYVDATLMQYNDPWYLPWVPVLGFTVMGTDGIIVSLAPEPGGARRRLGVTAHEVGHSLGLPHTSSTWERWLMRDGGHIWNNKPLEHSKRFQLGDFEIIRNHQSFYVPYVPN